MSLLGKNILNDLLKKNENKTILNSSNILNKTSKYNKISIKQLVKKIETTEIKKGNEPYYLMYFLHNAFNGNHDLLGFKFLWYYLTEKKIDLNPENIYKNYFKKSIKVKDILTYFLNTFYDKFLDEFIAEITIPNDIDLFIGNIKQNFPDTYYQILPFNLLIYYAIAKNISTEISRKFNEIGNNPTFIDFSIKLYNVYNEQTSPELMVGLFPYLLENPQFQILIADIGLKKIGKGIGDKLWIYKDGKKAGILTSNITKRADKYQITEEEDRFLITYNKFIENQINNISIITELMKLQQQRLNLIKEKSTIEYDGIVFDKKKISIGDFVIPYQLKKKSYYFTLGSQEYQFQINKDNVLFFRGKTNILSFKNTDLIEIPYQSSGNIDKLTINEILLIIIFSLK